MSDINIFPIPAFNDNYIWCLHNQYDCVVVDPGDAGPVLDYCRQNNLTLCAILVTHHHWDHTNGIETLLQHFGGIEAYGPAAGNTPELTKTLKEGDTVTLDPFGLHLDVLEVPGHTLDHIAYVSKQGIFCGDTLFSAGCGRLFEGTPLQMYQSLQKLASLADDLPVYCTHEYTLANLAFANAVEGNNPELHRYTLWAQEQRNKNIPTLPTSIGQQKAINPFLRVHKSEVKAQAEAHAGAELISEDQVFATIRRWKDHF